MKANEDMFQGVAAVYRNNEAARDKEEGYQPIVPRWTHKTIDDVTEKYLDDVIFRQLPGTEEIVLL